MRTHEVVLQIILSFDLMIQVQYSYFWFGQNRKTKKKKDFESIYIKHSTVKQLWLNFDLIYKGK